MDSLELEAAAFDKQIIERMENGHIPDLRRVEDCDYFYNNPWRRKAYVEMVIGEQVELIHSLIKKHTTGTPRVLEVGCGPGYLSLELARMGLNVDGIDISSKCIEIANQLAEEDPFKEKRGEIRYFAGDLFEWIKTQEKYDAIIFLGALHHFPDQTGMAKTLNDHLNQDGVVIFHEPARDKVTKETAVISHLIKSLLAESSVFYEKTEIKTDLAGIKQDVEKVFQDLVYEDDHGENLQSVNDNEAGHKEMMEAFEATFDLAETKGLYALFHDIIGGLRFQTEEQNQKVAHFIKNIDRLLCDSGLIPANEFYAVFKKRS